MVLSRKNLNSARRMAKRYILSSIFINLVLSLASLSNLKYGVRAREEEITLQSEMKC